MTIAQANSERSESVHYRVMAEKLRELAGELGFAGGRKELLDLALRYDRKVGDLDVRTVAGSDGEHP